MTMTTVYYKYIDKTTTTYWGCKNMKIKVGDKYVGGIENSTKEHPIKLILVDKTEGVWNDIGLRFLQRKFPDVTFTAEV